VRGIGSKTSRCEDLWRRFEGFEEEKIKDVKKLLMFTSSQWLDIMVVRQYEERYLVALG
jgi:hypothetical protein